MFSCSKEPTGSDKHVDPVLLEENNEFSNVVPLSAILYLSKPPDKSFTHGITGEIGSHNRGLLVISAVHSIFPPVDEPQCAVDRTLAFVLNAGCRDGSYTGSRIAQPGPGSSTCSTHGFVLGGISSAIRNPKGAVSE